jgi:hemerythrin-like domain-containing protein
VAKRATQKRSRKRSKAKNRTAPRKAARRAAPKASKKTTSTARKKAAARSLASRRRGEHKAPPEPSRLSTAATAVRGVVAGAAAAVTSIVSGSGSKPDAVELLEREHRRFEKLLKQGEETTEQARAGRREVLATLVSELNAHELMEEKVLYPALRAHPQAREVVLEGFEEHHVADLIVNELRDVATSDEAWGAKFKVLKENIEHHIKEEEGNMFRLARGIFSREELRLLAARMQKIRPRK